MSSYINSYATLSELKGVLGVSSTTDDTVMRKMLEASTKAIDTYTNRFFYITIETKYYDGAKTLWIDDLLSVTTLKTDEDGDATYENELETTDYILYPLNLYPKTRIEINPNGDYSSFASGVRKGVEIAGIWGFGFGTTSDTYIAETTLAEALDATETDVDVASATNLSAGHTILVGTEQMYILSISTNTLTVERGTNGSTAATHDDGSVVSYFRYPPIVWQTCMDLTVSLYQNRGKRGLQSERLGDYSYQIATKVFSEEIKETLRKYRKVRI